MACKLIAGQAKTSQLSNEGTQEASCRDGNPACKGPTNVPIAQLCTYHADSSVSCLPSTGASTAIALLNDFATENGFGFDRANFACIHRIVETSGLAQISHLFTSFTRIAGNEVHGSSCGRVPSPLLYLSKIYFTVW